MSEFDRELSLGTLLPPKDIGRLCSSLTMLLDSQVALLDLHGEVLAGDRGLDSADGVELVLELEPIGYLLAPRAPPVARGAAASLVRQLLMARARYLMASGLHLAATQADYEELQRQNTALKESETRYKALAEELEARVAAQVKVLDERQRQLYQAERLASVGQLAAGVAHEINNPIAFVRSNLSTAQKYLARIAGLAPAVKALSGGDALWVQADMEFIVEDFGELLTDSIGGVDRVARIVNDLKGFSSIDKPQEGFVDINDLLNSACTMAEKKLPPGAALIRALGPSKPFLCLPGQLAQAFLAVLENAVLAVGDKGGEGEVHVSSHGEEGHTLIRIHDNGHGIDAAVLPRIFDPFFTTRPVGQGTGLGLTVARDILNLHDAKIVVESTPGTGTTVTLSLPD